MDTYIWTLPRSLRLCAQFGPWFDVLRVRRCLPWLPVVLPSLPRPPRPSIIQVDMAVGMVAVVAGMVVAAAAAGMVRVAAGVGTAEFGAAAGPAASTSGYRRRTIYHRRSIIRLQPIIPATTRHPMQHTDTDPGAPTSEAVTG